jgi:flagellar L-ring protein FlgH
MKVLGGVIVYSMVLMMAVFPANVVAQGGVDAPVGRRVMSWTSDRVVVSEGYVITILIDELTLASADADESARNARGRDVSIRAGTGAGGLNGGLQTGNDAERSRSGESSRRERFSAEMSVQIVELLPNGAARIEGTKKIQIDDHEQEITVRGIVRTQDISVANTIESWRVAQAELLYASNGKLQDDGGGIWSKILNLIVP